MFERLGVVITIINIICLFGLAGSDDIAVMDGSECSTGFLALKVGLCIIGAVIGGLFVVIGRSREV